MATVAALAALLLVLRLTQGPASLGEIGLVYAGIATVYSVYPLLSYVARGCHFGPGSDRRLLDIQPSAADVAFVAWHYVVHLVAFVVAYVVVRGPSPTSRVQRASPQAATLVAAVTCVVLATCLAAVPAQFFDLSARTYAESWTVHRRMPLPVAQLANRLNGVRVALEVIVLAALFVRFERTRRLILLWLATATVLSVCRLASRTDLFLLFLAAALLYHWQVRHLRLAHCALSAVIALVLFTSLGLWRADRSADWHALLLEPGEFGVLFGNALHLQWLKREGPFLAPPTAAYFSDVLALVPQQLVPFSKVSPANWYAETFFPAYAESGGGLAFGVVSEAVLGGGLWDGALRGAVLGVALAGLHRIAIRRIPSFWHLAFYIWTASQVHHLFRGTTFSLLSSAVYGFLPAAGAVAVLSALFRTAFGSVRAQGSSANAAAEQTVAGSPRGRRETG